MEEANTNYIVLMEPQQSQNGSEIEVLEFLSAGHCRVASLCIYSTTTSKCNAT